MIEEEKKTQKPESKAPAAEPSPQEPVSETEKKAETAAAPEKKIM